MHLPPPFLLKEKLFDGHLWILTFVSSIPNYFFNRSMKFLRTKVNKANGMSQASVNGKSILTIV